MSLLDYDGLIYHTSKFKTFVKNLLRGKSDEGHTHDERYYTENEIDTKLSNIDAGKITSGTISVDRLPQGALERLTIVTDDTERFKLTSATVQKGDTVKVTSTEKMYYVVDETKLSTDAGYEVYAAGTAASVPWSGVTNKPSSYPASEHSHMTVNGHTVNSDVPSDAKFTDTTYSTATENSNGLMTSNMVINYNKMLSNVGYSTARKTNSNAGVSSTVFGMGNTASGDYSMAVGNGTTASGQQSFAAGLGTTASGTSQFVTGRYNKPDTSKAFIVGGGSNADSTKNLMEVSWTGGVDFSGNIKAANFNGLASNFTTEDWKMGAAAPLVKQLYEENQSLKEQVSTLNSNSSGIKKQLNAGESAYIYIDDGDWHGGIVLISVWKETANLRGIYMAQPGNGNNINSYQTATVMALKDNTNITVEAAVDSKYSSVKITNNHTSEVFVRAVALCGSQPEWIL